ncbi:MAG: hypothetical protein H6702_02095 [Myxococcales bacterium]|nr:hypothetical protein [Myxococcales bacterium]
MTTSLPAPGRFHGPARGEWGGQGDWQPTALERALLQAVGRAVTPSAATDCLAREYAARFAADGADPDPATVGALARHCGAWAPPTRTLALTGPDQAAIERGLDQVAQKGLSGAVGLGAVQGSDGQITVALVFPAGHVALDPVPRAAVTATLRGRADRVDGELELWRRAGERVTRVPLHSDPTGGFTGQLARADAEPVRFELAARRGRFRQSLALIDLGPAPVSYPAASRQPRPPIATVRQEALETINTARKGAGLGALVHQARLSPALDDWLGRVAGGAGGDAPEGLLDPKGRPYARMAFAVGEGADGAQAAALILDTPTGRATLLDPELGEIAVGARPFDRGEGVDLVIAALQPFAGVKPEVARLSVRAGLNQARARAGHPPLAGNQGLDEVAQSLAEASLAGALPWDQVAAAAGERLAQAGLIKGGFAVGGVTVAALAQIDFAAEPAALDPRATVVGLGVAGGPLPNGGAPRHLVIYLTAEGLADGPNRAPHLTH